MSYVFFNERYRRSEMIKFCETIIQKAREELKDYFSFSHRIIGSGKTNLMTINGNDKHVDLDYNLLIERNKKGVTDAKKIHALFFNALRNAIPKGTTVHESTSVFTIGVFPLDGYQFSFDVAIIERNGKGVYQKIIFDKQNNRFIWNKLPDYSVFWKRYDDIKKAGKYNQLKNLYLEKKNQYISDPDKSSFLILMETVNDIWQTM